MTLRFMFKKLIPEKKGKEEITPSTQLILSEHQLVCPRANNALK